jgi:hypothetical protein
VTCKGDIQNIALFGKRPSLYYVKKSSNKKRHEGQSIQNISRTLKVFQVQSHKPSSSDETGSRKEDKRISSLELTAPQIAAQINASQRSSNRHISTSVEGTV